MDPLMGPAGTLPLPVALPPILVDEPTVRMTIGVNKSPFAGKEGKLLQSRVIRDRLYDELETNVALRVSETDNRCVLQIDFGSCTVVTRYFAATHTKSVEEGNCI
jgi:predicted membrane GTPase involved in stress response